MYQLTPWDCVPACIAVLMRRAGRKVAVRKISKDLGAARDGVTMRAAVHYIRSHGLKAVFINVRCFEKQVKGGAVILTSLSYKDHAVLVTGVENDGRFRIRDPNPLKTWLPWRRRVPLEDLTSGYSIV